ncbi:hypothetical protein LMG29739_05591 [Paraburkholderia solisilvae]|uniref:Uncharacterized protein n=2 Tax=Paraburkholderia solisilvae TaxID=624376 RepID=A0A6J5EUJ3_9BURK|nr:hypothetical protein LMG29739_05591 [Paraburkholderia solisilvae]
MCIERDSGARGVDAFLNLRILPAVPRELLARMATGAAPAEIRLSGSPADGLVIDFVEPDAARRDTRAAADLTT